MALLRISIALFLTLLLSVSARTQDKTVEASFDGNSLSLLPYLLSVDTDKPVVTIRTAENTSGLLMELPAKGDEAVHRWVVVSLTNSAREPRDVVVTTPHQGFAGSGVIWPKPIGSRIQNVVAAGQATIAPLRVVNSDAFALRIEPRGRVTVAMELTRTGLDEIDLWQRTAFDARTEQNSFYRGAILGIAMLLGVVALSLYAVRTIAVFPFASVFIWSSIAFIALESGYLLRVNDLLPRQFAIGPEIRAVIEGLMVVGLILCVVSFADLRRRRPVAWNFLLLAAGLLLALPVYGWFEPAYASGIARIAFVIVAALGCFFIFIMWREGAARARVSLLSWAMIVAWTALAAVAVLAPAADSMVKPFVSAGLVLVILTMCIALAQFAFAQGFLAQRFFAEDARRALALAASQQCVWDWQVEENNLHVGEDLEKLLGLRRGSLKSNTPEAWLDHIHPADRSAYLAAVEEAERRGHGSFSQEFRLRRGDGTFRWFLLRARAIPGAEQRAARCVGTLCDITATRRAQDQLLSDAVHDRVTGLPNKALLHDRIEREISAAGHTPVSGLYLMLIDLDRFKAVNDGLGHETGDGLLKIVGRRLATLAGEHDTVARMPGDQFAILFHGDKPKRDILPFTDKVRAAISKPVNMRTQEIFLTASIGVAALREGNLTAEGLVKDAAVALYEAKRRGKDTVEFFRQAMRDDRSTLVVMEAELRRAIERNEIEVLYQPIARLADMELAGFEALVRWRHKTMGLLGPETFIGLAETTGVIKDIGYYVLNEAGRQLGIWQRAFRPHDPLFVAVNVSSSQFLAADLIDDVKGLLTREGLVRDTLKLEITESIVMENPELVIQILDRLKKMGIGVACDDFGTGYSSLSNLRRMPFDTLKVDRSFVEADVDDAKASLILESIILLAHDLGLTVVAEGVRSQEDVARLGSFACDFGQGYFIGEPMTAKQVVDVLSGVPLTPTRQKTTIDSLWKRVAGTSKMRVAESKTPIRDAKPQAVPAKEVKPQAAPAKETKPQAAGVKEVKPQTPSAEEAEPRTAAPREVKPQAPAARDVKSHPAPARPPMAEPTAVRPQAAPVRDQRTPLVPSSPPTESKPAKPAKSPVVLLPPLTPPVFAKTGTGTRKPAAEAPPEPVAEAPPKPAAEAPSKPATEAAAKRATPASGVIREETSNLVKSVPAPVSRRPLPGGAPMAPRAPVRDDAETEEAEDSDLAAEVSGDENEDEIAARKAKAARLGKKLRRKVIAKEQPPAET